MIIIIVCLPFIFLPFTTSYAFKSAINSDVASTHLHEALKSTWSYIFYFNTFMVTWISFSHMKIWHTPYTIHYIFRSPFLLLWILYSIQYIVDNLFLWQTAGMVHVFIQGDACELISCYVAILIIWRDIFLWKIQTGSGSLNMMRYCGRVV